MTDREIVKLFFNRDEDAIKASFDKYGKYCRAVAMRILNSSRDAEECVNDALFAAWNSIPPEDPKKLGAFLSHLTRNTATARLRSINAEKRGGGEAALVIEELEECLPAVRSAEDEYVSRELIEAIQAFIKKLPRRERDVFMSRYYYAYRTDAIARSFGLDETHVRMILFRTRKKLGDYLAKEKLI